MASSVWVVGGWMRGRVVVIVRLERGAARLGIERERKRKGVGLVPDAGARTCCASGNPRCALGRAREWRGEAGVDRREEKRG